jgi:hypothetical protein
LFELSAPAASELRETGITDATTIADPSANHAASDVAFSDLEMSNPMRNNTPEASADSEGQERKYAATIAILAMVRSVLGEYPGRDSNPRPPV